MDRPGVRWPQLNRNDVFALLLAICVLAFGLRIWSFNWDQGHHQHPDERYWSIVASDISAPGSVGEYFDSATSPANPYNNDKNTWVYGTLPLYAGTVTASWMMDGPGGGLAVAALAEVGVDLKRPDGQLIFNPDYESNIVGRLLSALIDTGTVVLVFFLASALATRKVGLLAALLQALTVLHIQYAHFFGAEPWVAFFATAAMWGSVRIARGEGSWRTRALTGLMLGLAIASKLNGLAVAAAPLAATLVAAGPSLGGFFRRGGSQQARSSHFAWVIHHGSEFIAMVLVSIFAFRIFQPYYFVGGLSLELDERFIADFDYISGVNSGGNVPWVIQWIDRTPLLFPLRQLFTWGMGPGLALIALFGVVFGVRRIVARGEWVWAVPLAMIAAYLLLVSRQFNPVIRYLLPAYPTAIALGAVALAALWKRAVHAPTHLPAVLTRRLPGSIEPIALPAPLRANWTRIVRGLIVGLVVANAFYALAFVNGVYNDDYTRLEASEWIIENVPDGAAVSSQLWDDRLPLGIPGANEKFFEFVDLDPFRPDSSVSTIDFINRLDQIDYVIEASNKLYGAIPQIPAKYPSTVAYYDTLFDGRLGFTQVAEFHSAPSLLGITFDDRDSEETFTVYDHPTVTVWEKNSNFSVQNAALLLNPDRADIGVEVEPKFANANALQLRPDDYAIQQAGGTYNDVFSVDGTTTNSPWVWWLLWIQVIGLASVPMTTWLFARLPGQGFGLSKLVGFIGTAMPLWLLVSWGIVDFSRGAIWTMTLLFVAIGIVVGFKRRAALIAAFNENRRLWIAGEVIFVVLFMAVVLLRYANPDLWQLHRGGEKPMELAYFTAVARSTSFPPYDPWFAGGFLNYYYVGWYLLAVPARALSLPPDIAFNLGVATYAALGGMVIFTIVSSLAGMAAKKPALPDVNADRSPIKAGVLGVVMFMVIGNLDALRQTTRHLREVSTTTRFDGVVVLDPVFEVLGGLWFWIAGGDLPRFDWWDVSRVNKGTWDITEFPGWTVLFADLHPHFMGMTILGLVVATVVAYARTVQVGDTRRAAVLAMVAGMAIALVRMVHTWDFPTAMVLGLVGLGIGWLLRRGAPRRAINTVTNLATFAFGYLLIVTPYMNSSQVFENEIQYFPGFTSNLDDYIAHWGLFLVIALGYFVVRWFDLDGHRVDPVSLGAVAVATALMFAYVHVNVGSVAAWILIAVVAYLSLVLRELSRDERSVAHLAAAGLIALGFVISLGVEMVRVGQDIDRLNTIFKFWLQVWQLFAIGLAFGAWWVAHSLGHRITARRDSDRPVGRLRLATRTWQVTLGVLVIFSLLFTVRAPGPRLDDRFDVAAGDGLRGYAWLDSGPEVTNLTTRDGFPINLADDVAMIEWLRANIEGSPTMVEAVNSSYEWFGRVTSMTGLPAVVGWDHHQRQQRGLFGHLVDRRWGDVKAFYGSFDPLAAEQFLRRYDVSYIVLGSTERALLGTNTPAFDQMLQSLPAVTKVFGNDVSAVYEVDRNALLTQGSGSISSGLSNP